MIINFHPKSVMSRKGAEIIERINKNSEHKVVHVSDKTFVAWKDIVSSDEKLILVSPIFWWGPSYLFDKWAQDVFAYGFAYKYNDDGTPVGLLKGRQFEVHLTHGTPHKIAEVMRHNIRERLEIGIFGFCDSKVDINFYDLTE